MASSRGLRPTSSSRPPCPTLIREARRILLRRSRTSTRPRAAASACASSRALRCDIPGLAEAPIDHRPCSARRLRKAQVHSSPPRRVSLGLSAALMKRPTYPHGVGRHRRTSADVVFRVRRGPCGRPQWTPGSAPSDRRYDEVAQRTGDLVERRLASSRPSRGNLTPRAVDTFARILATLGETVDPVRRPFRRAAASSGRWLALRRSRPRGDRGAELRTRMSCSRDDRDRSFEPKGGVVKPRPRSTWRSACYTHRAFSFRLLPRRPLQRRTRRPPRAPPYAFRRQ